MRNVIPCRKIVELRSELSYRPNRWPNDVQYVGALSSICLCPPQFPALRLYFYWFVDSYGRLLIKQVRLSSISWTHSFVARRQHQTTTGGWFVHNISLTCFIWKCLFHICYVICTLLPLPSGEDTLIGLPLLPITVAIADYIGYGFFASDYPRTPDDRPERPVAGAEARRNCTRTHV